MTKILEALGKLDSTNDNHWTSEGLPRIETVKFLSGMQNVTREDITKVAPNFARHNPELGTVAPAQATQVTTSGTATDQADKAAPAGAAPAAGTVQVQDGGANGQVQQEATQDVVESETDAPAPSLEAQLHAAQERLAEIEQAFVQLTGFKNEARAKVDELLLEIDRSGTKETSGDAIRSYLNSQVKQLEARSEQLNKIREMGLDMASLAALVKTGAPIDAAMARRSSRGMQRPMYNGQTAE